MVSQTILVRQEVFSNDLVAKIEMFDDKHSLNLCFIVNIYLDTKWNISVCGSF